MKKAIGTLQNVDLRNVWEHEAHNFTPWLAEHQNLERLGDAVGMKLEPESQEEPVGPFRADILCRDVTTDSWVLIENQLERTDHNHLGQVLTYAAGLDVATIIWIAKQFTEEHRATLDWLNEKTSEGLSFIGVELELWQIDGSAPAPRFSIVAKPNHWARQIKQTRQSGRGRKLWSNADTYWAGVLEHLPEESAIRENSKPTKLHDIRFKVPWKDFWLKAYLSTYSNRIGTWVTMRGPDWKMNYEFLEERKDAIETAAGQALEWISYDDHASIHLNCDSEANPKEKTDWQRQHQWIADSILKLHAAFDSQIRVMQGDQD